MLRVMLLQRPCAFCRVLLIFRNRRNLCRQLMAFFVDSSKLIGDNSILNFTKESGTAPDDLTTRPDEGRP